MATHQEVETGLAQLSDEDFARFKSKFGSGGRTRNWYVETFGSDERARAKICRLLSIPTEEERQRLAAIESSQAEKTAAEATVDSAASARRSAIAAEESARYARLSFWLATAVAATSLMISIFAILK
jgi:hypothetical protein